MGENDKDIGMLIGSMESLTKSVDKLTIKVDELELRMNSGRGFLAGLSLGMAALGGGVGAFAHKIFEGIVK